MMELYLYFYLSNEYRHLVESMEVRWAERQADRLIVEATKLRWNGWWLHLLCKLK